MNIFTYSVNLPGPYHIQNDIPCQDAYALDALPDADVVAAIADGLGSAKHSDVGAELAASTAVTYCRKHITPDMDETAVLDHMKTAFQVAMAAVEAKAFEEDNSITMYDTTLCLALYDGDTLYYGQSGDSGLIVLYTDGSYEQVTKQQQDDMGRVYPLRFGPDYWEFGKTTGVTAAMLATDGILNHIFHPLLADQPVPLDVPLASLFMEHHDIEGEEAFEFVKDIYEFVKDYPEEYINDDKTVVVMINKDAHPTRKPDDYYQTPDWESIFQKFMKKGGTLYDRLHKKWRSNHPIRTRISRWWRRKYLSH